MRKTINLGYGGKLIIILLSIMNICYSLGELELTPILNPK